MRKILPLGLSAALLLALTQPARAVSITDFCVFAHDNLTTGTNVDVFGLAGGNNVISLGGGSTVSLGITGGGLFTTGTNTSSPLDVVANGNVSIGGGSTYRNVDVGGFLTTGTNVTFTGNATVGSYVTLGGGSLVQGNVQAGGATGGGTSFNTGTNVTVQGNVDANGNVVLGGGTVVQGNVTRTGTLTGTGVVLGTDTLVVGPIPVAPAVFTPVTIPSATAVTYGALDVTASTTAATPLTPGSGIYRDINVGTNRDLHFVAGTYHFRNISLGGGTDLFLDLTGGPLTILVDGSFGTGTNIDVFVWDSGSAAYVNFATALGDPTLRALAADVFLEGHNGIGLGGGSEWFGTIFASSPTGLINLGTNVDVLGALYSANDIGIGGGSVINGQVPNRLLPPPGPGPGPEPVPIPEPGTVALLGMSTLGFVGWLRRRRA